MPGFITHYLFGDRVLQLMKDPFTKNILLGRRQVFNLGTQGPDIFFYHGAWPWSKGKGVDKIGNRLHHEQTGAFYSACLEYVTGCPEKEKTLLTAYICGHLCHYSLDCHAHPYIYYRSGFGRKGEASASKYDSYHHRFETAVDVLMLQHVQQLKPGELNTSSLVKVEQEEGNALGRMYAVVLKKVYGMDISPETIYKTISDMVSIRAALRDKSGMKKKGVQWIENLLGRYPILSGMIHPSTVNDGLDYLNRKHAPWYLPWDNTVKSTASFFELSAAAATEATPLCEGICMGLSGKATMDTTLQRIGNRSYSTGVDCTLDTEFKYFDCIFEK